MEKLNGELAGFINNGTLKELVEKYTLKPDEYIDEKSGEIYCVKCKTTKTICLPEHNFFRVGSMCKCMQEKLKAQEEQEQKERRMAKLQNLINGSLMNKKYAEMSFDAIDTDRPKEFIEAKDMCESFVRNWERVKETGQGFYLHGPVGTGKSLLTACLGKALLEQMVPVMFTSMIEISRQLRKTYANIGGESESDLLEKICDIDLLILDDIGTETLRKSNGADTFLQEKLFDIINERYLNCKPTIFTSNYSIQELKEVRGVEDRTIDRINEMCAKVKMVSGSSYRKKLANEKKVVF